MALRMERSVANAAAMADFLKSHPLVKKMNYAGLSTHPGYDIHVRQATSGGAVLSFETGVFCLHAKGWGAATSVLAIGMKVFAHDCCA
jgi:cystathionine beta-lyase/cystathionine gamma-synthase